MRVFITGATGFIGSHVTRAFLARGHEVAAVIRPTASLWRLRDLAGQFKVLPGSLDNIEDLHPALLEWQPQVCIHLAWYAEPGKYLHANANLDALKGALSLLEELAQIGCKQLVGAGTCAEYDTDLGYLKEDSPSRPDTLYAAAKLSFCLLGQKLAASSGMLFTWARIFYPYGPFEDRRRVVPAVIQALLAGKPFPATEGEQVRDYLHVEDIASAFLALTERAVSGIYNVASGTPVSIRQLLEMVGALVGRSDLIQFGSLPYRDWEPAFICGNNERLKELGWKPRYTLKEGLEHTYRWWVENESVGAWKQP